MDTAQWPQEIMVKSMEETLPNTTTTFSKKQQSSSSSLERKMRPQKEQALNCPRCCSTNTKFCYYNNYSLSQPRYFCKTCRRYWTEGGSLRNIPVGGGSRKNKHSSFSSTSSPSTTKASCLSMSSKKLPDLIVPPSLATAQNPNKIHQDGAEQNLNLGFSADFKTITELIQVPNFHNNSNSDNCSSSSALELFTGISPLGLNSLLPMTIASADPAAAMFSPTSGFASLPEFKPSSLSFSLDGWGIGRGGSGGEGHGSLQESSGGRVLFAFEDLKQVSSNDHVEQNRDHHHQQNNVGDSTGYWSGLLGGGSW